MTLVPEDWGGSTVTGCLFQQDLKKGLDELLEMIILTADLTRP
jgi:hypothetical protein